jgi:diguanylate cyclase (GGDEF)-like protein/putative nucleotidyltransferase with HDIG domain
MRGTPEEVVELGSRWRGLPAWMRYGGGISLGLILFLAVQILVGVVSPEANRVLLFFTSIFCGLVAAGSAFRRAKSLVFSPRLQLGWRCIGLYSVGFALSNLGSLALMSKGVQTMLAFPIDDAIRVLSYLPLILGLATITISAPVTGRIRLLLDGAISASSVAALSWFFVVAPIWSTASARLISGWTTVHPIGDILAVLTTSILLTTTVGVRQWRVAVSQLGIGTLLVAFAGNLSTLNLLINRSDTVALFHIMWPAGLLLIGISALCWSPVEVKEQDSSELFAPKSPLRAFLNLAGPYLVAMGSYGSVALVEMNSRGYITPGTFLLGAMLMAMVVIRQLITLMENQRLGGEVISFNRDLEQIVERRTAQLQSLYSLSKAVGNSLDVEGVLRNSTEHAVHAMNGEALIVNLTPFAFSGFSRLTEFVRHQGLEQDPWVLDRLNILDTVWNGTVGVVHDSEFKRHMKYAMAPVICKGKALGWICVLRRTSAFDKTDSSLLEGIATEIGTALENARLYEVARQMADIDSVTGLLNHRATQERFDYIFKATEDMKEPLSILMIDIDNFKYFNDTYGHLAGDHVLKCIARLLRDVARPHDTPARYGGDEFMMMLPNTDLATARHLAEAIEARVVNEGYPEPGSDRIIPFGVSIGMASYPEQSTNRNELLYLADHDMYKQKRSRPQSTSSSPAPRKGMRKPTSTSGDSFDLLDSMISAVDNKDYYTRAHSEEVTEYALWIAQELGLSDEACKTIRYAGLLHDVGKIGIPDEILRKPGHLTDEEYDVMKQHPVVGAMIVSSIPDMTDILPGVKHHHERWDGQGYPDSLAGESIPLLGRILAVADTFSAMTTDRPYRKGMHVGDAVRKIKDGSGTQFDPQIVTAFVVALEKRQSQPLEQAA